MTTPAKPSQSPPKPPLGQVIWFCMLGLAVSALIWSRISGVVAELPYSDFLDHAESGQVVEVYLGGEKITVLLAQEIELNRNARGDRYRTRMPAGGDPTLLPLLRARNVVIHVSEPEKDGHITDLLLNLLPVALILYFFWFMSRGALRTLGDDDPRAIGRLVTRVEATPDRPEVTFDDVAGQANAKREVKEVVDFLKDPEPFREVGASVPRGLLLMGPPGTGKTLMARALAGEAGVPFFSISGSAFIEVYVGVGASRVRKLFAQAREQAPSIVFIDELDSIGRTRGAGVGGGHDEREQTLNQILAELDGFQGHEAVIVLAATNRPDVLDPALLRPGRFDRHVTLDLPDRKDRLAILELFGAKVKLAADVDLAAIAAGTPGFSGAELKNLVNEAAIQAATRHAHEISAEDFHKALDHLMLGAERSLIIQPEERWRLAVHEAGHALVAFHLPNADPIYKMTIIPRGRALGVTQQLPEAEHYTLSEPYLKDRLAILFGGRAAEHAILGDASSGAEDDIRQATALARAMVTRWGMSDEIGPVDLRQREEHPFLGLEMSQSREHSERSAGLVDEAVKTLLAAAEKHAADLVSRHQQALTQLAKAVLEQESLDASQIAMLLDPDANLVPFPGNDQSKKRLP